MPDNLSQSMLMIDTLVRLGITRFVVSPGSRSTPLTVAVARYSETRTTIHFDERGAAFYALGYGKASGKPAVLICTSGTAVANYFPAVIEASMDNIPLIILSADRPPELIGVGANQAIYQENIYGNYPRLFLQLPPPDENTEPQQIVTFISKLVQAAGGPAPGPVHLNCQFREPLLTEPEQYDSFSLKQISFPDPVSSSQPQHELSDTDQTWLENIVTRIAEGSRGLLVLGRAVQPDVADNILKLARLLDWPIFPDVQSSLRFQEDPHIINHFDLILLKTHKRPELVLHFGGAFTSKRLLTFLNDTAIAYYAVRPTPDTVDPNHQLQHHFQTDIDRFCQILSRYVEHAGYADSAAGSRQERSTAYLHSWQQAEQSMHNVLHRELSPIRKLNEPGLSYHLSNLLPADHDLMLANSMAVREMDMFANPYAVQQTYANRGASGIDGNLATALGIQAASGNPMTLVMGDLAALHDLNSLALLKNLELPFVMILVNNQGGGIFNFLPVRSETDVFDTYFGTPHTWTFAPAAEMFQIRYAAPENIRDFQQVYSLAATQPLATLIEIRTDRYENHAWHEKLFQVIRDS